MSFEDHPVQQDGMGGVSEIQVMCEGLHQEVRTGVADSKDDDDTTWETVRPGLAGEGRAGRERTDSVVRLSEKVCE